MSDGYPIKLVRDRVQEVDTSEGLTYRPVRDAEEHRKLLREKLGEEVVEYLVDPSIGELADILEALECLAWMCHGVNFDVVEAAARKKFEERGGFRQGTVMETVEP